VGYTNIAIFYQIVTKGVANISSCEKLSAENSLIVVKNMDVRIKNIKNMFFIP